MTPKQWHDQPSVTAQARPPSVFDRDTRTLVEIMNVIGRQAQANGLTPEILQSILDEPDNE